LKVKQVRFSDKVEMKEHLNIEYDDTADANEVGANEVGSNGVSLNANEVGANEVGANEVGANGVDTNEVGANGVETNIEVDEKQNKDILITRKDYNILLEKIDGILNKSKLDISNVIRDLLKSKQV